MEDFWLAAGGAGQKAVAPLAHQPLVGLAVHVAGDVLLDPRVHPGPEAFVQPCTYPLVGLWGQRQRRCETHVSLI